jgi:hypothetical protein
MLMTKRKKEMINIKATYDGIKISKATQKVSKIKY